MDDHDHAGTVRGLSLTALATLVILAPSTASAATLSCRPGAYGGANHGYTFPSIGRLRAVNLPRLDGAKPCKIADYAAAQMQESFAADGEMPHYIVPPVTPLERAPAFHCGYRNRRGYEQDIVKEAICLRVGHDRQRVTMILGS